MAWDGNGVFTRTNGVNTGTTLWATDRDAATKILATRHDTHDQDLATGIQACLTKNNESKPTADFLPNSDAAYAFGSASKRWTNVWLSAGFKLQGASFLTTVDFTAPTANRTITLPNATGTVALTASPTFTGTVTADVLVTTGNTTLGNAQADTLNVGNGDIIKDSSGRVGIGVTPAAALHVGRSLGAEIRLADSGVTNADWGLLAQTGNTTPQFRIFNRTLALDRLVISDDGRIWGTGLHNNASAVTGTTNQYIASGTYTPTITNVANVGSSTARKCTWKRTGNMVQVSGQVTIDPTAATTTTQFRMSLPIASNFGTTFEAAGTMVAPNAFSGQITAVTATDDVLFDYITSTTSAELIAFQFGYEIL